MANFLHMICYLAMRWSKAVNAVIFYSAIKSLSNYMKLKSLRSNKFKQQLSKYFPSAALLLRLTCKQKQTQTLPSQVYTPPAFWFPQSVVLLLGPLARNKCTPTNKKFYLHEFPPTRRSPPLTHSLYLLEGWGLWGWLGAEHRASWDQGELVASQLCKQAAVWNCQTSENGLKSKASVWQNILSAN